ncbi:hypothetical protein [Magnetospira sp. QH-2]|uniref:hypothetical protein n=1 Tax=Magnetospira sp. (strain QH-2) TaxID=1288970 RepID=UPI0003E8111C|nr:hypothetical protein [Magnetospira sp. QH-2]CCQ75253.1 protein of unknown function [Magnetospira sp. QH-2]
MADDPVTKAIAVLNDALKRDPEAITKLINMRADCAKSLADHPTIQTIVLDGSHKVGLMGLLNGILGDSPSGVIGARGRQLPSGLFTSVTEFVDLRKGKVDLLT